MDDFLSKPFSPDELAELLERWLPGGRSGAVAAIPSEEIRQHDPGREAAEPGSSAAGLGSLDSRAIHRLRAARGRGKSSLVMRVSAVFLDETPSRLQALREAIDSEDFRAVEFVSHSLKSDAANLGATHMVQPLASLEALGKREDLRGSRDLMVEIEECYPEVREAVRRLWEEESRQDSCESAPGPVTV